MNPDTFPTSKVVILNGFPGTGKCTIAKQIKRRLPGTIILDNHLLIDPVEAVLPGRGPEHYELRRAVRAPIFDSLHHTVRKSGHVVVITACLAANEVDAAVADEHLAIVRGTPAILFWVNVECDWSILRERVHSEERCKGAKTKLVDVGILHELVGKNRLFSPERTGATGNVISAVLDASGDIDTSTRLLMKIVGLGHSSSCNQPEQSRHRDSDVVAHRKTEGRIAK